MITKRLTVGNAVFTPEQVQGLELCCDTIYVYLIYREERIEIEFEDEEEAEEEYKRAIAMWETM
jgi:hypothetical protein